MLAQSRDAFADILEEDFNRPVESIMRCEDFKSNFARRLSNRYITRSPVSGSRQETVLKLRPSNKNQDNQSQVSERIEMCTQLSKSDNTEQNREPAKPPDKHYKMNAAIRNTEVNALNMEVETLRWQLAQTEASRQMHIALLKQIVTFLSRVKEHFECQKNEDSPRKHVTSRAFVRSLNFNELPRSRSVVHVNKNIDYSISPAKKISTRKISKSISNVSGYKDCNGLWNHSKLSLVPEHETSMKIGEEMSRLITLANTVLSTKLPDLACSCTDNTKDVEVKPTNNESERRLSLNVSPISINYIKEDYTMVVTPKTYNGITNNVIKANGLSSNKHIVSLLPNANESEGEFNDMNLLENQRNDEKNGINSPNGKVYKVDDKLNDYNSVSNFVEDESGFSSMSSFQEIGIPIISVIPPSPCKELGYMEELPNILDDTDKWKKDAIEVNKQNVKVFWV